MITIWFEAHATSLDNEANIASGWNDVDLSERGKREALELSMRCRTRGIDALFTSDMQRAVKTALPLSEKIGIPITKDARLRECDYGDMTQHPKKDVDAVKMTHISNPFSNGESYQDCMLRMHEFMEDLRKNYDGKTVLIIGHRATHYGIENFVLHKPLDECIGEHWKWQPGWKYKLK